MFNDIKNAIGNLSALVKLSTPERQKLLVHFPEIPPDYIGFLTEIGSGNLGVLQIYSAPADPYSVYSRANFELVDLILIGDDFQGNCFAFDTEDSFRLVEIDPRGHVDQSIDPTFEKLIRRFF